MTKTALVSLPKPASFLFFSKNRLNLKQQTCLLTKLRCHLIRTGRNLRACFDIHFSSSAASLFGSPRRVTTIAAPIENTNCKKNHNRLLNFMLFGPKKFWICLTQKIEFFNLKYFGTIWTLLPGEAATPPPLHLRPCLLRTISSPSRKIPRY
jgi:hypothetical protein